MLIRTTVEGALQCSVILARNCRGSRTPFSWRFDRPLFDVTARASVAERARTGAEARYASGYFSYDSRIEIHKCHYADGGTECARAWRLSTESMSSRMAELIYHHRELLCRKTQMCRSSIWAGQRLQETSRPQGQRSWMPVWKRVDRDRKEQKTVLAVVKLSSEPGIDLLDRPMPGLAEEGQVQIEVAACGL